MSLSIHTNIDSLIVQRNYCNIQNNLRKTLERLSSGLKINKSADDPAGMAISEKLRTQIRGIKQAYDNCQDGINLIQTTESALQIDLSILHRIRELSIQASNDSNTQSDRAKIQEEINQLRTEITKIALNTEFNTKKLLDGSMAGFSLKYTEAKAEIVKNIDVGALNIPMPDLVAFIDSIIAVNKDITVDAAIQFKLFASDRTTVGLEVRSSLLGLLTVFQNVAAVPTIYGVSINSLGPTADLITLGLNTVKPISSADLTRPLQVLVNEGILSPIIYGDLIITGGTTVHPPIAITPLSTINDIITSINTLPGMTASYSNGRITVTCTSTAFGVNTSNVVYNSTNLASSINPPGSTQLGPPYPVLNPPAPGFTISGGPPAGSDFPIIPAGLNSSIDFSGTSSSFQTIFNMPNMPTSNLVTKYWGPNGSDVGGVDYINEIFADPTQPSLFIRRTTAIFGQSGSSNDIESSQTSTGAPTGLTAADLNTTFQALNTPKINDPGFGALGPGPRPFNIYFGSNGQFDFTCYNVLTGVYGPVANAGFDYTVHSIKNIIDGINAYGDTLAGNKETYAGWYDGIGPLPTPPFPNPPTTYSGVVAVPPANIHRIVLINNVSGASNSDIIFDGNPPVPGDVGSLLADLFDVPPNTLNMGDRYLISTNANDNSFDNADIDPSLALTLGDLTTPLVNLFNPRFPTLVQGDIVINGTTVYTINPATDTVNTVIAGINNYTDVFGNKPYTASFDVVTGRLSITFTDREDFALAGPAPPVNPGTTVINGNTVVEDGVNLFAPADAPKTYNNGSVNLVPFGANGPQEYVNSPVPLPAPYNNPTPAGPPPIIANISYGGTSNIANVLFLPNSGVTSPVATGVEFYDGTITPTGHDTYILTSTRRTEYSDTSVSTSTGWIGKPIPSLDDIGKVAMVQIIGKKAIVSQDNSIVLQIGPNEGQTIRVGIDEITSHRLNIETLNILGTTDEDSRIKAQNAIGVVDQAIDMVTNTMSRLGAIQNRIESTIRQLSITAENLSISESTIRDTDFAKEISNLTSSQILAQAGINILSQTNINKQNILSLLYKIE